ncbi:MAG TPA: D-alanyl-D-alanine carboxypeptidase/D-alanyl-D-alanine-endopeptidase [Candidatus Limnocylindria bacterium]|nr:D-alanyl-D-alanine carboxypeptidase/D-alanyl-D-alanine-endopeptidase [Candidatus Limnocylindria bacterium]
MNTILPIWLASLSLGASWATKSLVAEPASAAFPALRQKLADTLQATGANQGWWGVSAVCVENGVSVFATNDSRHFVPASSTKLYTVGLALNRLGGDYRIRTSAFAESLPDAQGVLHGDLAIVGRGDPTLSTQFRTGNGSLAETSLIESIKKSGIKSVEGRLVVDGSWLRAAPYGSGWEWDDMVEGYAAPVSALTLGDNVSRVAAVPGSRAGDSARLNWQSGNLLLNVENRIVTRTADERAPVIEYQRMPGSNRLYLRGTIPLGAGPWSAEIASPQPEQWFATQLRAQLEKSGISIAQSNLVISATAESPWRTGPWKELAGVDSPPVSDIAALTLKPSQNLYAQLLLLHVGEEALKKQRASETNQTPDLEAMGIRELNRWVGSLGIATGDVAIEEGSGLSRRNLVTPRATIRLLRYMATNQWHETWMKSLPVGGIDGTLQKRFIDGPARGKVHAKTGSLRSIQALAGYVTTAGGQTVAFALYANQFTPTDTAAARKTIDQWVEVLAAYSGRIEEPPGAKN